MNSDFTINATTLYRVTDYAPFEYANEAVRTRLIGDGTAADGNELLQEGALAAREAQLSVETLSAAEVTTIQGYYHTREDITFTDCDDEVVVCYIFDFTYSRGQIGRRSYSLTLVER